MEETIDTLAQSNIPAQSFRITFKGQDFQIRILEKELHRGISEISILLDGMVQKLKKIKTDGILKVQKMILSLRMT